MIGRKEGRKGRTGRQGRNETEGWIGKERIEQTGGRR
jgi:hypothetical protein